MPRRLTNEQAKQKVLDKHGGEIELTSPFTRARDRHLFRCSNNHDFFSVFDNVANNGSGCPKCSGKYVPTNEEYKEQAIKLGYEPLEVYVYNDTNINHKCLKCGHVWSVRPSNLKSGKGCPKCSGNYVPTNEEYKEQAIKLGYEPLEVYVNTNTKMIHKCLTCDYVWKIAPATIKAGHGCPNCAPRSKGEQIIEKTLMCLALFESEKRFPDCRDKRELPFDFYVYENNLLIEYQGRQHLKNTNGYFLQSLEDRQRKDKIKRDYARANQYLLASIPHTIVGDNLVSLIEHLLQCNTQPEVHETIMHHMLLASTTDTELADNLKAIEVYQLTA